MVAEAPDSERSHLAAPGRGLAIARSRSYLHACKVRTGFGHFVPGAGEPEPLGSPPLVRLHTRVLLLIGGCAIGCSRPQDSPSPCPRDVPAFRLLVTAADGPIPSDTELTVTFGGSGVEEYSLRFGNGDNKTVCCVAASASESPPSPRCGSRVAGRGSSLRVDGAAFDGGASGSTEGSASDAGTAAIACDLWTDGAAEIEISASGYALLQQTLRAEPSEGELAEDCAALQTKEVSVSLARGDAGMLE